jgi:hypothetical protein
MANFCASCGTGLVEGSGFCQSCGTSVGGAAPVQQQQPVYQAAPTVKSKTPAVLLAVFLGYWTWLYTFKKDKVKFFIALPVSMIAGIVAMVSYFVNYTAQQALVECYTNALLGYYDMSLCETYSTNYTGLYLGGAIGWGIWLWAVIDTARKKQDYFTNYPNGR